MGNERKMFVTEGGMHPAKLKSGLVGIVLLEDLFLLES